MDLTQATDDQLWEMAVDLHVKVREAPDATTKRAAMHDLALVEAERMDRRAASYLDPEMLATRRKNRDESNAAHAEYNEAHGFGDGHPNALPQYPVEDPVAEEERLKVLEAQARANAATWRRIAAENAPDGA